MPTLLITIDTAQHSVDLEVPGEVLIGEMLPALVAACGLPPPDARGGATQWLLSLPGGGPFPPNRTLIACGVVDGARLVLQGAGAPQRVPDYYAVKPTFI